jgi:hypothetical protein
MIPGHPQENIVTRLMAANGRNGDDQIGHLTRGDVVVPQKIVLKDPAILTKMKKLFEEEGADYRTHVVGSGYESRNPATGAPEFGLFGRIFKFIAPAAGAILGSAIPGLGTALGASLGAGVGGLASGAGLKGAAIDAAGAGLGSAFLGGSGTGTVADSLTGSSIPGASTIGGELAGSTLGASSSGALSGALEGTSISGLVNGALNPPAPPGLPAPNVSGPSNAPIPTTAPRAAAFPSDLSTFSGLDPLQQGSGIATQGLYGQGTSSADQNYFLNLLQRQLITGPGQYANYNSVVNPTEQGYLQNTMGLQFDPNTNSLLQAIANKQAQTTSTQV